MLFFSFRQLFGELRMVVETFCAKPQCPQFVRGICLKGVEVIGRLAPANWGSLLITSSCGVIYTEALRILESSPIVCYLLSVFWLAGGHFAVKYFEQICLKLYVMPALLRRFLKRCYKNYCMVCTVPEDGSTDFAFVVFADLVNCFVRRRVQWSLHLTRFLVVWILIRHICLLVEKRVHFITVWILVQ